MNAPVSPFAESPLSPRADALAKRIDAVVLAFARHWLAILFAYGATVIGLAVIAPLVRASSYGILANFIYVPYRLFCHQRDNRSFHLAGEKMAFCERDLAIVGAATLAALLFALAGGRLPAISIRSAIVLALPMALDGGTQLVGLRESTWPLRLVTGSLFGASFTWFALSHLQASFSSLRDEIITRREVEVRMTETGIP